MNRIAQYRLSRMSFFRTAVHPPPAPTPLRATLLLRRCQPTLGLGFAVSVHQLRHMTPNVLLKRSCLRGLKGGGFEYPINNAGCLSLLSFAGCQISQSNRPVCSVDQGSEKGKVRKCRGDAPRPSLREAQRRSDLVLECHLPAKPLLAICITAYAFNSTGCVIHARFQGGRAYTPT